MKQLKKVNKVVEERNYGRYDSPKPVAVGDEMDVTIESVGGQGDGIAKVSSFVIFVNGANKGENCRIKVNEVKRTYAIAEKLGESERTPEPEQTEAADEKSSEEKSAEPEETVSYTEEKPSEYQEGGCSEESGEKSAEEAKPVEPSQQPGEQGSEESNEESPFSRKAPWTSSEEERSRESGSCEEERRD